MFAKKLCQFFALFFALAFCLPAQAQKTDWDDKNYDFSKPQKIMVYDVSILDKSELPNDLMENVLKEDYMKTAARLKFDLVQPQNPIPNVGQPLEGCDLYVVCELLDWHDDSYTRPGYTSWESKTMTRERKDSDGKNFKEHYTISVPVTHPPRTVYTSTVRMRFGVFDAKTGKRVMARDELRLRDESKNGQQGIFGRISKSFFDDLNKKLRRARGQ